MFVVVSCRKCGDTSTRGDYEEGCPSCGADEEHIIIQGKVDGGDWLELEEEESTDEE